MRPNDMPRPFAPDHSDGDDLVQRLRARMDADELELEAADEIERLRAEVAEWKRVASAQAELHDTAERELAELRERIASAPVIFGSHVDAIVFQQFGFESLIGHRVRLVRED